MIFFNEIERIQRLHKYIMLQKTGTPDEFASRLHISRRQLYNILDELRDLGAVIEYSRSRYTFYYGNDFDLNISIKVTTLNNMENRLVNGGFSYSVPSFVHRRHVSLFT